MSKADAETIRNQRRIIAAQRSVIASLRRQLRCRVRHIAILTNSLDQLVPPRGRGDPRITP